MADLLELIFFVFAYALEALIALAELLGKFTGKHLNGSLISTAWGGAILVGIILWRRGLLETRFEHGFVVAWVIASAVLALVTGIWLAEWAAERRRAPTGDLADSSHRKHSA